MARRRGWAEDLLQGFSAGMQIGNAIQKGQMRGELRELSTATPTTSPAFSEGSTDAVQQQLAEGAGMGDARRTTATQSGTQTSFLGKTYDKPLSEGDISQARLNAQAGIFEKYGDFEGSNRLKQMAQQRELTDLQIAGTKATQSREAQQFAWQKSDRERDDAYKADLDGIFSSSAFGQKSKAYSEQMAAYNAAQADYVAKRDAGDTTAIAPTKPVPPRLTPGETMADAGSVLYAKARYGKATPEDFMQYADKMKGLQDEGYLRAIRAAHEGAPLTQVVALFNQSGKGQIDPQAIIEDRTIPPKKPGDVGTRIITVKQPDGTTLPIDTRAELGSLGKSESYFTRAYQAHSMASQDRQAGIAGAQLDLARKRDAREQQAFDEDAPVRQAKADIASVQSELADLPEGDPKIPKLQAKLAALKTGLRGGTGMQADPAHVKEAQALVSAGAAPDMATALELVVTKPDKVHQAFVEAGIKNQMLEPEKAVAMADKTMEAMGWQRKGRMWTRSGGDAPAAGAATKGAVVKGDDGDYEFLGGDPKDKKNYRKISRSSSGTVTGS